MNARTRFHLGYALLALLGVLVANDLWTRTRSVATLPYSEFERLVSERKVKEVWVTADAVVGELREPLPGGQSRFATTRVDRDLAADLAAGGVTVSGRIESSFLPTLLSWVVPALVFLGIWMFLARRMGQRMGGGAGLMAIGKSKARVLVEADTGVTFADVAGVDEAKEELQEVVRFLRDPASHGRLGARMPKGVLLVGPPGTGKTLLARAVAGEARVPFFSIGGSEFVEMFVGVGAARVRDLFEQARAKAPCIIFVDELDALGRARGPAGVLGGHDEKEQTLNQLLVELDGFDPTSGIVLLAATNRPEVLDPALLRAGRFDRQVLVDRPDRAGRAQVLAVHMRKVRLDPGVAPDAVAALTPGFTGAELANLVNEAALAATRRGAERVALADFQVALERIVAGLERKNRLLGAREREIVAHHEIGHALVAAALPHADPVHKISIVPRGLGALGYTLQRPSEDRYLATQEQLEARLAVLMGGRAAEELSFGHRSTGAADDLARATEMARAMASRYGMVPGLGAVSYDAGGDGPGLPGGRRAHAPETAREVDLAVREILDRAQARARAILVRNREVLQDGARELLSRETLEGDALERVLGRVTAGRAPEARAA